MARRRFTIIKKTIRFSSIAIMGFLTCAAIIILFNCETVSFYTQEITFPNWNKMLYFGYRLAFHLTLYQQKIHPTSECNTNDIGLDKKLISFSLFIREDDEAEVHHIYLPGILDNLKEMRSIYPGWVMRIYTNIRADWKYFPDLRNKPDVTICNVTSLPKIGNVESLLEMVWRFLPIGDPTVRIFIVRDLDSLLTLRERSAVEEWENSNKTFHTMRDNPAHTASVMGGLWGAKNYLMSPTMKLTLKYAFIRVGAQYLAEDSKHNDQDLLNVLIYRPYKHLFVVHDSHKCKVYRDSVPFPKENENPLRFVGMKSYEYGWHDPIPCEVACRPSYGKYWSFC